MPRRHPIPRSDSNTKIRKYIEIIKEAKDPQNTLPPKVKKYFASGTLSFVFYKSQLDAAFILAENANAVKVYLAAEEQPAGQGQTTITPTAIVIPCFIDTAETSAANKFPNRTDDGGDQYPITFNAVLDAQYVFEIDND
jgi:hypothetical protein